MKLQSISLFVSALFISTSINAQTPDPGTTGPHSVIKAQYNLGDLAFTTPSFPVPIEMRGSVHYPSDLINGPYPVIMYLHGRHETCFTTASPSSTSLTWPCVAGDESITSYEGYDYSAAQLASHGYIVISISANAINATDNSVGDYGMLARGELMQHHLDLWNTWNTVDSLPFNTLFNGRLDLTRVGTMGHSRGGEGAVRNALLNTSLGSPYGIKAVLTLAPVDFGRYVMNDIPLMNVSPYCDGDVSDLQGVHFYDDARYNVLTDEAPKHNLLMLGANHNFYNTVWTPGLYPAGGVDDWDDYYGSTEAFCGTAGTGNKRMTPAQQQNSYMAYASAFFRTYVGGDTTFIPLLEADDIVPPLSSSLDSTEAFMSFHAPASKRLDFNRTLDETTQTVNNLTAPVTSNGLVRLDVCADDAGETDCGLGFFTDKEPHSGDGSPLGMPQLAIQWDDNGDWYQNDVPNANKDVSMYKDLEFRMAVNWADASAGPDVDFMIQLIDSTGAADSVKLSDYTNASYFPMGTQFWELPKAVFNSVKIPLLDFDSVDITKVKAVKFLFNQTSASSILLTDFTFSGDAPPPVVTPPTSVSETSLLPISIYPNPTNSSITVNLGKNTDIKQLGLFDVQGKSLYQVKNVNSSVLTIDLSAFEKGIYVLTIQGGKDSKNYKVVRQ